MQHVGEALGVPPENVKEKNLYEKGQVKKLKYYAMVLHPYIELCFRHNNYVHKYCNELYFSDYMY